MKFRFHSFLMRPASGTGLVFAIMAFGVVGMWFVQLFGAHAPGSPLEALQFTLSADNPRRLVFAWSLVTLALSILLGWRLLRRPVSRRLLGRILLVVAAHAAGSWHFYTIYTALLATAPLFILAPDYLLNDTAASVDNGD